VSITQIVEATICVGGVGLAFAARAWRRSYFLDRPLEIWGGKYADAQTALSAAGERVGLTVERVPDGLDWVTDLFVAPVWFFWGDLRTRRPERHLQRWCLSGARPSGRGARVYPSDEGLRFELDLGNAASLWVSTPDRGAPALAGQEGLRALLPTGGPRWTEGLALIERAMSAGVITIRTDSQRLIAFVPRGDAHTPPSTWPALFDLLEALARLLEPQVT